MIFKYGKRFQTNKEFNPAWLLIYFNNQQEPRFFTLTKRDMAKFCHRHMGEIYVMAQINSVFFTGYFGI